MIEPSNPASAPGELFRQLASTARHIEVQWSPSRAQNIMRGVDRQRRQQQRRRAMLPMLCAASLVVALVSVASWAAWNQRSGGWAWPWSAPRSTVIPQVPPEAPLRLRHGGTHTLQSAQAAVLPATPELTDETLPPEAPVAVDRADSIAQLPPIRGTSKVIRGKLADRVRAVAPPPVTVPAPIEPPPPPEEKPTWQQLAHDGQFEKAYSVAYGASESAGHQTPPTPLGAGELLLLADVARLSHHPADAVSPLTRLLSNHATDPRAPLAAFTLGRVLLDDLGRPREAADAFRRVQTLELQGPDGPLAQDALAREVEAWSRAGEPQRAKERAQEYVRHYPTGRRLRSVRHYGELD